MEEIVTGKHLTQAEAQAVLALSVNPDWIKYQEYLSRIWTATSNECRTCRDDHRYHQGRNYELSELARIEEKAKNILSGT
jgi:hypothetical protein